MVDSLVNRVGNLDILARVTGKPLNRVFCTYSFGRVRVRELHFFLFCAFDHERFGVVVDLDQGALKDQGGRLCFW